MRSAPVRTRVAVPADAATMLRTMYLGFATYRAFAPAGWSPPPVGAEAIAGRLRQRGAWALLADVAGEPAAHVALFPDERPSGAVYLWQLFVRPPWWGSGLAASLHDAFVEQARAAGYRTARLYTPAAHARARRFYERRGWRPNGPSDAHVDFGMPLMDYRCRLRP
jgi:GNAT superfamily N-acetyltransferase